jgi:hypothetical protein
LAKPDVIPLRKGDKIQGPNDRTNRLATEEEIQAGNLVFGDPDNPLDLKDPEIKDPPIDENAPEDKPADPMEVARSRGMLKEKDPNFKPAPRPAMGEDMVDTSGKVEPLGGPEPDFSLNQ